MVRMSRGKLVIIDVGHARGSGARGCGLEEHARCAQVAALLAERLRGAGCAVSVLDFPERGNAEDLRLTVAAANAIRGARLGVSLHCDASDGAAARGAHVCYFSEAGMAAARCIAGPLCRLLPGRAEGIVRRDDLYVLKRTRAPWVLCECGFITNAHDAAVEPVRVAECVAAGVLDYLGEGAGV